MNYGIGLAIGKTIFITFNYHRQVARNLELARQTLESWAQKYPADRLPHRFLSGFTSPGTGHYDESRGRRSKGHRTRSGFRHRLL